MPMCPNWQRSGIQNPEVVGSSPTMGTFMETNQKELVIVYEDLPFQSRVKDHFMSYKDISVMRRALSEYVRQHRGIRKIYQAQRIVVISEKHDKMVGLKNRDGPVSNLDYGL